MKRRLKILGSVLVVLLTVVILVIGNYFYGESVKRGSEVELHSSEAKPANATAKKNDNEQLEEAKSWFKEQEIEQLSIQSYDQLNLNAGFIQNDTDTDKAVILVHGFRKQGSDMGDYTKFYSDQDFHILMPDSRGHGESEGDYYGYGWHDRLDLIDWTLHLIDEYDIDEIVLHGNSAGAAAVLITSGEENLPEEVKAIVADSGYTTMKDELAHQLKHLYGLPPSPLLEITSGISKVRAGYFFGEVNVLKQVEKNNRPLFIIHGDKDDLVPTYMGEELFDAAHGDKELWIVPGAGHIKAHEVETEEFERRLGDFLEKHISK